METKAMTRILSDIIDNAPEYASEIAVLANWAPNYDAGHSPWCLFLDLIGYSAEEYGCSLFDGSIGYGASLGYLELGQLADALNQYAHRPTDVLEYVREIMNAEEE